MQARLKVCSPGMQNKIKYIEVTESKRKKGGGEKKERKKEEGKEEERSKRCFHGSAFSRPGSNTAFTLHLDSSEEKKISCFKRD